MPGPRLEVTRTSLDRILPLRRQYLAASPFQVRYHACHERGWTDSYVFTADGVDVGYGAVRGQEIADRDTAFECFVLPPFRRHARAFVREWLVTAGVRWIEGQTNDPELAPWLFDFAHHIRADVVLFGAGQPAGLTWPGATVRRRRDEDRVSPQAVVPEGEFVVELDGQVAGSGGFLLHYNPPFADVYMEIAEPFRRRGLGAFLVQEVIRECYLAGRVPAARCHVGNLASRATLTRAGLRQCGFLLLGEVDRQRLA